jgi:hypothetical protein
MNCPPPALSPAARSCLAAFALATLLCTLPQCRDAAAAAGGSSPATAAQDPKPQPGEAPIPANVLADVPDQDRLSLLVSANMVGRLEPCGCASGQLGGLARRVQYIGERRSHDLLLEGGNLVAGTTPLDLEKYATAITVLASMQHAYHALGVGQHELHLPLDEWAAYATGAPYVASDLDSTHEAWPAKPFVQREVRGRVVRIASLTLSLPEALRGDDAPVRLLPPAQGWQRALADAPDDAWRLLFVHGSDQTTRALVPTLTPAPHLVICCDDGYVEPTGRAELVGGVPVVFPGIRGRILQDITLYRLPQGPRAQVDLVPLQGSLTVPGGGGDPDVTQVLLQHREQVKASGLLAAMAGQEKTPNGSSYIGSQSCAGCHPTAFQAYAGSKHFHAFETLQKAEQDPKRYGWPVTHYPDCVDCHVVGYGEQTGFVSPEQTPHLLGVGCERCHGPGQAHATSNGQQKLGLIGGVTKSMLCTQCHDFEQSPNFQYNERWPLIQHGREPHQQPAKAGGEKGPEKGGETGK